MSRVETPDMHATTANSGTSVLDVMTAKSSVAIMITLATSSGALIYMLVQGKPTQGNSMEEIVVFVQGNSK